MLWPLGEFSISLSFLASSAERTFLPSTELDDGTLTLGTFLSDIRLSILIAIVDEKHVYLLKIWTTYPCNGSP